MSSTSDGCEGLPPEAARWVERAVGGGARVVSAEPLAGATSSLLHAVAVEYGGRRVEVVLRRFVDAEWLRAEPDLARHEAASLMKAALAGVTAAPRLLAYDERGEECGAPATLMTRLAGRVELEPRDVDAWLRGLAEAVLPFHEIEAGDYPWSYFPYVNHLSEFEPPRWSRFPRHWERVFEVVEGPRPKVRECFIHRDYHPNNVLWQDERVAGVVDWVNACRGAAGFDVAWCRLNLAQLRGVGEADAFLRAYESCAGARFEYQPYWDLMALVELLPGPPGVYEGWRAHGVQHLDDALMRERADDYLLSLVARL